MDERGLAGDVDTPGGSSVADVVSAPGWSGEVHSDQRDSEMDMPPTKSEPDSFSFRTRLSRFAGFFLTFVESSYADKHSRFL